MNTIKIISIALLLYSVLFAAETKIDKNQLPQAVLSAFEREYPESEITGVSKETEDGITYYKIESKDGVTERDILYMNDGTIYEKKEVIPESELPGSVSDTIKAHYSGKKITKISKITQKNITQYKLIFEDGNEITLSEQGKNIKNQTEKKNLCCPSDTTDHSHN